MSYPQRQKSRAYPHDLNAERALIAAAIVSNTIVNLVRDQLDDVDFYLEKHRLIWGRIVALSDTEKAVDLVTLPSVLGGDLERVGGISYLSDLIEAAPMADNAEDYAAIIKAKAIRRRLIQAGIEIQTKALEGVVDLETLVDDAEKSIFDVSQQRRANSCRPMTEIIPKAYNRIVEQWGNKTEISGIPTGFIELDKMLTGLQDTDLIILAARPSMGKTAFALNLLASSAIRGGKSTVLFSLEMSAEQLGIRLLSSEARVDGNRVRRGTLNDTEWHQLARATETIYNAPIHIDDQGALSVTDLRARCRRLHAESGLDLIMIDYLQLMRGGEKHQSREQEISHISRSLKALAKELKVPVLALSQLNRSLESRADKRPMMSDLRESGAIEQDADVIMFIYRDSVYNKAEGDPRKAEIIIGKQRNGPIGTVELAFVAEHTRFENVVNW